MKQPELLMSEDWPDPDERRITLANLPWDPTLTLYWPLAYLPETMGWLLSAEKVPADPTGQYYLKTDTTFYEGGFRICASSPTESGQYPSVDLTYDDLGRLIAEADTTVRRTGDIPPSLLVFRELQTYNQATPLQTRRYAGRLRVIDKHEGPQSQSQHTDLDEPF